MKRPKSKVLVRSAVFSTSLFPLLRETTLIVLAITAINALKAYDIIYAMTNGGPANSTQLLSTWMYFLTYNYNQVGLVWRSLWRAGHERLLPHPPHSHHRGGTNRRLFLVSHFLPDCFAFGTAGRYFALYP